MSAEEKTSGSSAFKLANVLLKVDDHLKAFPTMLYAAQGAVDYQESDGSLAFDRRIEFLSYFNGFSALKWRTYADIQDVILHLELVGDACDVELIGIPEGALDAKDAPAITEACDVSGVKKKVRPEQICAPRSVDASAAYHEVTLGCSTEGMIIIGFALVPHGVCAVRNAWWGADVDPDRIRDIRIAVATTTFKNEDYIIPNIEAVREQVLESDEPIARAFHMFVVDNGRTLDGPALSGNGVTVVPNANEGGAAGFARGMMEALESDEGFTHVLLMDDDVKVSPESFIRTFNLLSLATDEYEDAFINGGMLELEHPYKQFEDVARVRYDGIYERLKGDLCMDTREDVAVNELIDVEVPNAYGAWWYSCIPLARVRECGLPLPLFVRCDDVEFGMRARPEYMTMNGICVWHAAFSQKFRGAVDCYQYIRNYMIMNAIHGLANEPLFMARATRTLQLYLRSMAYETAELMIEGLEDYLKGPEWLANASGEELFKRNNAKAEKLLPLDEALAQAAAEHPELSEGLLTFVPDPAMVSDEKPPHVLLRLARTIPYDKHLLPDSFLRNEPATAYYGGYTIFCPDQVGTRVLVACDRDCASAHVRLMDRERWRALHKRWDEACAEHRRRGADVAKAYQQALSHLSSKEYWHEHLGLED